MTRNCHGLVTSPTLHAAPAGDAVRRFAQVSGISESLWDTGKRLESDWGSSGRRFKSCQPDQRKYALNCGDPYQVTRHRGPIWEQYANAYANQDSKFCRRTPLHPPDGPKTRRTTPFGLLRSLSLFAMPTAVSARILRSRCLLGRSTNRREGHHGSSRANYRTSAFGRTDHLS